MGNHQKFLGQWELAQLAFTFKLQPQAPHLF